MADFINIPPISAALERTLRALLRGEESRWPDEPQDEARFLEAIDEHAIAPLLYSRIALARNWPDRVREALRGAALRAAAVEPFRLADLRAVVEVLGTDALIVKGSALAYSLYFSPDLRPRGDTDIIIDAAQREAAGDALRAIGYSERMTSGDDLAMRQVSFSRVDANGFDHVYDVHWAIANTPVFADVLRFEELRERSVPLPLISTAARTISDVDALLYACVHRVAHHHDSDRLIWLADIAFLRTRLSRDDEVRFWRLAAERGVVGVCIRSIERAVEWFGGEAADAHEHLDAATIARHERTRTFLNRRRRNASILANDLAALGGWRARAKRLRQLAFPPAAYMREHFATRSRFALPWLYAYRAARGVARLFRRVSG